MPGRWRLKRPSHSTVVSYLALFVALGGTTAYAANTIGSADVINESLVSRDIKNGQIKSADIGRNQVTTSQIKAGNVLTADIADGAVLTADIAHGAVNTGKVSDESLTSTDLATNSVGTAEIADNAITGAKVANNTLTAADIAGADVNGGKISVPALYVANGRCRQLDASVGGAKAGEAVVFSIQAVLQDGIVIYGQRVPSDGHVTFDVCNFSGTAQVAISEMPVRVITFG
jgi:hypothetical protein